MYFYLGVQQLRQLRASNPASNAGDAADGGRYCWSFGRPGGIFLRQAGDSIRLHCGKHGGNYIL